MTIIRYPGKAFGRSKSVEHNGVVYTVVTAPDVSADLKGQTQQALEQLDANLAEAGTDKSSSSFRHDLYHRYVKETHPEREFGTPGLVPIIGPSVPVWRSIWREVRL